MDNNLILPTFIDASGEAYYQQSHVENRLFGKNMGGRFPNLFRRHATAEEIPILTSLGMRAGNQRGKWGMTLVKVDEINDMLENGVEKYLREKSQPLKNSSFRSGTVAPAKRSYHAKLNGAVGLKRPPFCSPKLVAQALLSSPSGSLTRREIASWISKNYPYYLKIKILSKVSNTLCTCDFFAKSTNSVGKWQIVDKYAPYLREQAYLPEKRKSETGAKPATAVPQVVFPDDEEIQVLTEHLLKDECVTSFPVDEAIKTIAEQECRETLSETSGNGMEQDNIHPRKFAVILDDVLGSPKIKPEVSNIASDLVENTAVQIKPEVIDTIDLVDDDDDEVMDQLIGATHHTKCKVEPTTFSTTNDSIDLTAGETDLILCPICDAEFQTREALGEHVTSHRTNRAPLDPSQVARDALQTMTSSLFGGVRNGESPIFVFSGNVYFNSSPATS